MLSNSYSSPWLGHTLELGSQGWRRAARAVPAASGRARAGVMLPRACGLCRNVCVCRDSRDSQPFCRDPPPAPPALPGLPPVRESLSFHLKAATMWQRTLSTLCVQTRRGTQSQTQSCRFTFAQPNSFSSEEKQLYTAGGSGALWRCCWGGSARRTLLRRACTFPVNKNSSSFVIFHYLKVSVVACFGGLFVCFFLLWN